MYEKIKRTIVVLLLWSQKYTKTDMLYLAKSGSWVMIGQACNSALSLVLLITFANLLPKETYGLYKYILSIAGMLNIFTLSGMNAAVTRATAQGNEGVLKPAVNYQLKWNLLMFVAFAILSVYYTFQGDMTFALSFLILGIFTPATLAFSTYGSYLEGKKKFMTANILSILTTLTYSLGMLCILFFTQNILWIIAVYALVIFVPSLIFYLYILKKFTPPVSTDVADTLKYGRELTYLRLIDPFIAQIDKVVLAHFWGPAQLATYSLALAIPNRATLFLKGWIAIGFPKFAEKSSGALDSIFWRRIAQGLAIGALATLAYVVLSPYLFTYVLPQYVDGVFYSQLLSIGFLFAIPNRYMSLLFASQGMSAVLFKRTIVHSTTITLMYVGLGIWGGIFGLVIANIVNQVLGFLLNIFMWQRIKKS